MITEQIILALDQSSTNVGYVLLEHPGGTIQRAWEKRYRGRLEQRMFVIGKEVDGLIARLQVDVVAVERPVLVRRRVQGFAVLNQLVGVLHYVCYRHDRRLLIVTPTEAKVALTSDGHADKEAMMQVASMMAGHHVPEHQADAIGIAFAASAVLTKEELYELA